MFFSEKLCSQYGLKIRFESLVLSHQDVIHNCFVQQKTIKIKTCWTANLKFIQKSGRSTCMGNRAKIIKKQLMIYGDPLPFDDIMDSLKNLEDEINNL